jgi:hypothetical protein
MLDRWRGERPVSRPGPPENAFAKLASLPHIGIAIGDIFRVPSEYLKFHSKSANRFGVVVALETKPGDQHPRVAHLIVGSTKPDNDPTVLCVEVMAGEGDLAEDTIFACDESSEVALAVLRDQDICRYVGRLSSTRVQQLHLAIRESLTLGPLKVLL